MYIKNIFFRYLLIGAINTAFGYCVFALLIFSGLHYSIALFFATIAGILFNFKTIGRFVFEKSDWRLIWKFIAVYSVLYGVNVFCIFILMMYLDNIYIANAMTLIFIALLGFGLNRSFVYEKN